MWHKFEGWDQRMRRIRMGFRVEGGDSAVLEFFTLKFYPTFALIYLTLALISPTR